ncbi:MAG: hypothetical protein AB2541_02845, partial [Candidatus Thiodiazotropha sp.]
MELLILVVSVGFVGIAVIRRLYFAKNTDSFFLGSKNAGILSLSASMTATWIGAASLIALSGWVGKYGAAAAWYLILPGIGMIILGLVGVVTIRNRTGTTLADYYNNKAFNRLFSLFLATVYTLILGAQLVGFAKLSSVLGFSYEFGLLIASIIVALYVLLGGFNSVRDTDVIQFILLIVGVVTLFTYTPVTISTPKLSTYFNTIDNLPDGLFITFVTLGVMMFVAQENHQRIKAANSTSVAKTSCIISGIILLIYAVSLSSFASSIEVNETNPLLHSLGMLSAIPLAIVSVAIMAAALSTADSALNIASFSLGKV